LTARERMLSNTHNERDTVQKIFDEIFKRDSKGKLRSWRMEQDGSRIRTIAGLHGGKLVTSEWTQCGGTNMGRSNERDAVAQATFEIEAAYEKKLTREYHRTIDATDGGAHFFKPMLAAKYEEFAPGFAQPKLDGVRCIARADGLFSREGKPIPGAPHIFEALECLFKLDPDLILDGELYNHDFKDDFNAIISMVKKANPSPERLAEIRSKVEYHVYDMPSHGGSFGDRSDKLNDLISDLGVPFIIDVPTYLVETAEEFDNLHGEWLEHGYEGSMWRADLPYEQKRSKTLRKRKEFQDEEFQLFRIEEGLGNWSGMAKRVVFLVPGAKINPGDEFVEDGELRKFCNGVEPGPNAIRVVGGGIKGSMERARELLHEDHNIVTVQFFAYTPDGVPRFPVATKFHGVARSL
jgi:DNA ligase-1